MFLNLPNVMSYTEYCLKQLYINRGVIIFVCVVMCFMLTPHCILTAGKALVQIDYGGLKVKSSYLNMFEQIKTEVQIREYILLEVLVTSASQFLHTHCWALLIMSSRFTLRTTSSRTKINIVFLLSDTWCPFTVQYSVSLKLHFEYMVSCKF